MKENIDNENWPICHDLPMYYNHRADLYACQTRDCRYSNGVSWMRMYEDSRKECNCVGISHDNNCPEWVLPL